MRVRLLYSLQGHHACVLNVGKGTGLQNQFNVSSILTTGSDTEDGRSVRVAPGLTTAPPAVLLTTAAAFWARLTAGLPAAPLTVAEG